MKYMIVSWILLAILAIVDSANILFYFGSTGKSHRFSAWPLVERLADKGHSITFLSPYPPKTPHNNSLITDIVPENLNEAIGLFKIDFINIRLKEGVSGIDELWNYAYYDAGIRACESILRNPKMKDWIEKSSFDLVVINALFNDCGYGLAYKFKAPHVIYSPTSMFPWWGEAYGLPEENWPELQYHYPVDMNFGQSVKNALIPLYWQARRNWDLFPQLEALFRKEVKGMEDLPSFVEIERNTSLIFVSSDAAEEFPRSLPPMVIRTAGIHCKNETKPLSKELTNFIDAGKDGFVFLSFGTYVTLAGLPDWLQDAFFGAMEKLHHLQFIVKHDGELKRNIPKNIKLVKWVSQQDVLGHPKIVAFICHGGLLGTQEGVYHGVPMIVIPLFAEQDYNAVRTQGRETGIALELTELTEGKLTHAISAVINDPKYRRNMKRLSSLFRDRPERAVDAAVWWMEYALRHKDLSHLQPVGIRRTWIQKRMLQIWTFIALVSTTAFLFILFILNRICRSIYSKTEKRGGGLSKNKKSN